MPECDLNMRYNEEWVQHAVPGSISVSSGKFVPELCVKYNFTGQVIEPLPFENNTCVAEWFSPSRVRCNEFIFDERERTIVNDVREIFPKNVV